MNLLQRAVERVAQHVGGTRVLALPLLRALAVVGGATWVALAPPDMPGWGGVALTVLVFFLYSVALGAALWLWPGTVLRLNAPVLVVDLSFALLLIHFTGARSTLFLALLLIAGVQSYYYGTWRGFLVAVGSGLAYLAVVWPTISEIELANMAIRLAMLVGTALGVGILADIETSERLKVSTLSAEALDRERFIRDILESLREGVVALDRQGCVRAWNHALAQRSGVPAREALGRPLHEVLPLVDRDTVLGHLGRLLAGAVEHFAVEGLEAETRDGARLVLNVKGSLLRQGGEPAGAVLLLEDVTDRVALERSARQAEKLAALGTLAAGLAHELNNPIGIMSSRVELMLLDADAQPLPGVVREDLQVLHRNVQRVARIAQGLLSFARPSPGEQGPVDVNQVVEDTLLLVEKDLVKHGIALRRRLAPGLPPVRGDANGLQQVVLNLLTNARDALGRGGEVVVETSTVPERPGALRLLVRDNGPGIPPDVLPRIFDPFFTTKGHGTGLGLSISHGIVQDHGGTLDVESAPGRGTTFVLTFPAVAAEGARV